MGTQSSAEAPPTAVGAILGGFRLTQVIGEGGMGVVFRGENVRVPTIVRALKVVRPHLAGDPEFRARFLREAELTDTLRHPNILRIENVEDEGGVLFMVMELLVGCTAAEVVSQTGGGLPVPEASRIVIGALTGLAHAHRQGVIHRDLKPGNIFVTTEGEVKLLDFGIARGEGQRLTTTGSAAPGTPEYYAPEFATGGSATAASDIYAVGITLYELLTGSPPFTPGGGTTHQAALSVMVQHATTPLPDPRVARPDLPVGLVEAVTRATKKAPDERFTDAGTFAHALDPYAGTLVEARAMVAGAAREMTMPTPSTRPMTPPARRPAHPSRRRWLPVALTALVLAGGGGALAAWLLRQPGHLMITVRPSDARVAIDGVPLEGRPPFQVWRPPGVYAVAATRGGQVVVRTVTLRAGRATTLELALPGGAGP